MGERAFKNLSNVSQKYIYDTHHPYASNPYVALILRRVPLLVLLQLMSLQEEEDEGKINLHFLATFSRQYLYFIKVVRFVLTKETF